jgi:hypothetical protein
MWGYAHDPLGDGGEAGTYLCLCKMQSYNVTMNIIAHVLYLLKYIHVSAKWPEKNGHTFMT